MAHVNAVGRLGRDVVTFDNGNGTKTHILNIALPRNYANAQGEYESDFVEFKAFTRSQKAHDFYSKHMKKGRLVEVSANFSSNTYVKNGETIYSTDVIIDDINPFHERISVQQEREQNVQQPAQQPAQQPVAPTQPAQQPQYEQQQQPQYQQQPQTQQAPPAQTAPGNPSPFDFL